MQGQTIMAKFRARVEELTLKKGVKRGSRVTQKEVAEASGVPITTLSRLSNNPAARMDADTVLKLMRYFECTLDELIEVIE